MAEFLIKLKDFTNKKIPLPSLPSLDLKKFNLDKLKLNLNFKSKTKEILGIHFEEKFIRIVSLKEEKDNFNLIEFPFEFIIPEDLDISIGNALKEELESHEIKVKDAVISLPVSYTIIKNVKLPIVPDNEIREAVEWNIKEDLNAIKDGAFFDYDVVSKDDEFLNIIVVIVKISDVEKVLQIGKESGLNVKVIDSAAVGLINLALKQKERIGNVEKDNFCIIHIDRSNSFVTFLSNGIIVQNLDFNTESYDSFDVIQKEESVTKLINEINYFFLTVTEPKQIYLSGYFSKYPEIKTMVSGKFEDKFSIIDLDPSIPLGIDYLSDDYKGPFNIAFSAALRGIEE